ncbi:MAG: lysostaphin resistance A-like protein [Gemmatimonadaceae bacterium]
MADRSLRLKLAARVALFMVASAAVLAFGAPIADKFPDFPAGLSIGVVTSVVTLGLTMLFVRWEGTDLESVGAVPSGNSPLRFAVGFLIGAILVALHVSIEAFIGHVQWARSENVGSRDTLTMLITYILLASREELAFHGYPLRRLRSAFGMWPAQIAIALVFAAEHAVGGVTWPHALFGAGVGSLLFGMAALATRGLAVPIGIHAAWNLGDWMSGGKGPGGLWNPVGGYQGHAERATTIGYVFVMLSATLCFWLWERREAPNATTATPDRTPDAADTRQALR